jgi:signal transduction histidine kinase
LSFPGDRTKHVNGGPALSDAYVPAAAHEVLSPLLIAQAAVEMLAEIGAQLEHDPAQRRPVLSMLERDLARAVLLMDRMSLAADVEHDTVVLAKKVIDLEALVQAILSELDHTVLQDRSVTFLSAAAVFCEADPRAMREIVGDLLANVAAYGPPAPITVVLEQHHDTARLVVRDHGVGVLPADAERIFEKFPQVDADSPGVGLGLFIARGLARAHGGNIVVSSAPERGSQLTLTVPALR